MTTTQTLVGRVTDTTPESLEYGAYRGWVEIDAGTGEWLRDVTDAERQTIELGEPVYSVEYNDLRPVLTK